MIPYFSISVFHLGPLTIHTWGSVVSVGFAVALWVAYHRARRVGLDSNAVLDLGFWILIGAFLGARLFHVFFYEWAYYGQHAREIFRIDQGGLSSFGGFIGAGVAFVVYGYFRVISTKRPEGARGEISHGTSMQGVRSLDSARDDKMLLKYVDVLIFAWPLGHAIARIGCFLTHMHPGRLSNVPWAVQYPGGARLDMGLIESVALLSYWVVLVILDRRLPSPVLADILSRGERKTNPIPSPMGRGEGEGRYLISGMLFYGVMRFVLDFFRATDLPMSDARYFGLTPAQYGSIVLIVGGIIAWQRLHKRGDMV